MNSEEPWGDPSQDFQAEDYNWTEAYAFHASKNKKSFFFVAPVAYCFGRLVTVQATPTWSPFLGEVSLPETVPCFYRGHCKKIFFLVYCYFIINP